MRLKGKYNPVTGKRDIPEPKEKGKRGRPIGFKPKKKEKTVNSKKMGRPKSPNTISREKAVFIVEPPKKGTVKRQSVNKDKSVKSGRPKKVYTPEEIAEREERQRQRLETTVVNRSKEFVQPWCETVLKFRNKVDSYFENGANTYTIKKGDEEITQKLYTWTGLAYYLGFSSRESLNKFGKRPEFKEIVEKAKLVVERGYEEKLHSTNPTGAIFALKNFGWVDTTKTDLSVTINPLEKLLKSAAKRQLPPNISMVDE